MFINVFSNNFKIREEAITPIIPPCESAPVALILEVKSQFSERLSQKHTEYVLHNRIICTRFSTCVSTIMVVVIAII